MSKPNKTFRLSDQVIGQVREILQLAMLTGTNFVDHLRAFRLEESTSTSDVLILSKDYVEGWNLMSEQLHAQAAEKAAKLGATLATDEGEEQVVESDNEVVISRDPKSGKLFGKREKVKN